MSKNLNVDNNYYITSDNCKLILKNLQPSFDEPKSTNTSSCILLKISCSLSVTTLDARITTLSLSSYFVFKLKSPV